MGFQQRAERFGIEPTVCVRRAESLPEGTGIRYAVQQLHFPDQTDQAQPKRGIRNPETGG